jgi:hypothetical protein
MSARRTRPRVPPAVLRLGARLLGRRCLNPALPWPVQRARLDQLTRTSLLPRGTTITEQDIAGLRAEVTCARDADAESTGTQATGPQRTVVRFHGGRARRRPRRPGCRGGPGTTRGVRRLGRRRPGPHGRQALAVRGEIARR